ncbi:hypothetical protein [Mycobacterium sp. E3298]|uniref:hypothetical protein n=1 Tax=Mycobacterium sp. E3298 TaxID=1856865 RepID=UPI0034CF6F78
MPATAHGWLYVVLINRLWPWRVRDIEPLFTRPRSRVAANAVCVKNFLSRRHKFVARHHARVGGITVATELYSLHLCNLLRQRLLRGENLIDLMIARIRNIGQSASQIVDCVGA